MYKKSKLKNGVRIILAPMRSTKTVTVLVMVGTGSKNENEKNRGISHFLEHMFFKGTKKRPSKLAISKELDKVGGSYNAFTGKECTGFYAKVDNKHCDLALDVIS
ncbi:MAG: insulinase family protein, partial [Candidatus Pacebacteria bacterium]|nr:insulinase family protein [Candidatus Paceibacterota bacterium]